MASKFKNITASTLISSQPGTVERVIVNSHTTGTFRIWDGSTDGTFSFGGTYTPATGSSVIDIGAVTGTAIYVAVNGTANLTVLFNGDDLR